MRPPAPRNGSAGTGRHALRAWTILALALPAASASASPVPVTYASSDGFRILAHYYRPEAASARAVVILPDPAEGKARWSSVADSLRVHGFHVLVPDLRGSGESSMQRGLRRDRRSFTALERSGGVDARAALRYLRDLPVTAIRGVALVGSGEGAACALQARAADLPGTCCAALSPRDGILLSMEAAPQVPTVVLVGRDDLLGLETALRLSRLDAEVETWLIDAAAQGVELLQSRPDLLEAWTRWIALSLETAGG